MTRTSLLASAALAIAACAACAATPASAADFGFNLGATPILVLPALNSGTRSRLHLEVPSFSAASSGEVFCSWTLTGTPKPATAAGSAGGVPVLAQPAQPALAPFGPGSFMIEPEHPVDYSPGAIPSGSDLWCVAYVYSSTTGTVPFTVDVLQSGL